jgi:hypothetical protein
MEKSMFMDWQNLYPENGYTATYPGEKTVSLKNGVGKTSYLHAED